MRALVVYESMWGNTERIAHAVAEGLGGAQTLEVNAVSPADLKDLDLLVIGGPTHAFAMTRPSTRHDAVVRGAPARSEDRGIREWLAELPEDLVVPVATFDTRLHAARALPGSAAKGARRELTRHHHGDVIRARSFYVEDTAGPLMEGELQRAAQWGAQLASASSREET
jgi:hypothetical protein